MRNTHFHSMSMPELVRFLLMFQWVFHHFSLHLLTYSQTYILHNGKYQIKKKPFVKYSTSDASLFQLNQRKRIRSPKPVRTLENHNRHTYFICQNDKWLFHLPYIIQMRQKLVFLSCNVIAAGSFCAFPLRLRYNIVAQEENIIILMFYMVTAHNNNYY